MAIRETIRRAEAQPDSLEGLRVVLCRQIPHLHNSIRLPADHPEDTLLDFAIRYIEHVPNMIEAVRGLTREAGIYDYTSIFLDIAEGYFIEPPPVVRQETALNALMEEAYLTHRLLEEVNDRVLVHCGFPLTPMDMTRANIIVHELIGEPQANKLDFVVFYATETNRDKEILMDNPRMHRFTARCKKSGWQSVLARWPCLAENLSINLSLKRPKMPSDLPPGQVH